MAHGDVLLLFTDGMNEAQNSDGEPFGDARIRALVEAHHQADARSIAIALMDAVTEYSVGSSYTDDRTVVVIKRR
jgi:sigma-B regulation protein RsbU (phosphoserine phosphatase)